MGFSQGQGHPLAGGRGDLRLRTGCSGLAGLGYDSPALFPVHHFHPVSTPRLSQAGPSAHRRLPLSTIWRAAAGRVLPSSSESQQDSDHARVMGGGTRGNKTNPVKSGSYCLVFGSTGHFCSVKGHYSCGVRAGVTAQSCDLGLKSGFLQPGPVGVGGWHGLCYLRSPLE